MHATTFDAVEYLPTAHAAQLLAPALVPVFVIEPAGQSAQLRASFEPAVLLYVPGAQSVHAATFDTVEYLPTAHAVHVVAPPSLPVSVIEPASQSMHDGTFDSVEYVPAAHLSHLIAPALVPVSVIEPAWQLSQYDWPSSL